MKRTGSPENQMPFEERQVGNVYFRKFSKDLNSDELKWHRDKEDRIIIPIKENNWLFQRDNQLPEPIVGEIKIKSGEWHRIIKGNKDLEIKIIKL